MTILARRIAGATAYLGAPAYWTPDSDGDCGHLAIREHGDARAGKGWVESAWEVTPDDIERLREGRSLIVRIHGWQPPIALYIDPQKPDLLPQDIARKAWSDAEETAFQVGVEAMRELAGYVAVHACLTPPDGGSPTEDEREMCGEIARQIYAAEMPLKHGSGRG